MTGPLCPPFSCGTMSRSQWGTHRRQDLDLGQALGSREGGTWIPKMGTTPQLPRAAVRLS